jgi:hypothetical protein
LPYYREDECKKGIAAGAASRRGACADELWKFLYPRRFLEKETSENVTRRPGACPA